MTSLRHIYLLTVCLLATLLPLQAQNTIAMIGDTISIRFPRYTSYFNYVMDYYLSAENMSTTAKTGVFGTTEPSLATLWLVAKPASGSQEGLCLKNIEKDTWLRVSLSGSGNAIRMALVDNHANATILGVQTTGYSKWTDYATQGRADGFLTFRSESNFHMYVETYGRGNFWYSSRITPSDRPHLIFERWTQNSEQKATITAPIQQKIFTYAADDTEAGTQALTIPYKIHIEEETYFYNVPMYNIDTVLIKAYKTRALYYEPTDIAAHGYDVSCYWYTAKLAASSTETNSFLEKTQIDNTTQPAEYQETPRVILTQTFSPVTNPLPTGDNYQTVILPVGRSPLNVKKLGLYANCSDTLIVEVKKDDQLYAMFRTECTRLSFHYAQLDNLIAAITPTGHVFPANTDLGKTFNVSLSRATGTALLDIYSQIQEGTSQITTTPLDLSQLAEKIYTFQSKSSHSTASWLSSATSPEDEKTHITVYAETNTNPAGRAATWISYFKYIPPETTIPIEASVEMTIEQRGSYDSGATKFIPYRGVGNKDLNAEGKQDVHTTETTIYYTANENIQLTLNERAFYGYVRWYDYTSGKNPVYDAAGNQTTSWTTQPQISGDNYSALFTEINPGDGANSHGLYTTFPDTKKQTNSPVIRGWTTGQERDIVCDISNYTDYRISTDTVREPTLSYRQVFHLKPAKQIADSLDKCTENYYESYNYIAPTDIAVYLNTQFIHRNVLHASERCYFFYGTSGGMAQLGSSNTLKGKWYKTENGTTTEITSPDYVDNSNYLRVSSSTPKRVTYELKIPAALTQIGKDILLARFIVEFIDKNQVGPSTTELISDAVIKTDYISLAKQDFNFNLKPQDGDSIYYLDNHMPWEQASYGYAYVEGKVTYNRASQEDHKDFPFYGEYCLLNKVNKEWAKGEQHGGAANGYCMYVDGTQRPGLVTSISTNTQICSGQQLYCYAWIANPCPISYDKGANPIFRFNIQGRNKKADGTQGEWEDVAVFFAGEIARQEDGNEIWHQIVFPLTSAHDYDESRVSIYNFANSNTANDFLIDDVCLFASRLPLSAYQATTTCVSESREATIIRIDYTKLTGDDWMDNDICYQIYDLTLNTPVKALYYDHDHEATVETDYGTIHIPDASYDPQAAGDSCRATVEDFVQEMGRELEQSENSETNEITKRVFIKAATNDRWVLYMGHILSKTKLDTKHKYEIRIAKKPSDLPKPECANRTQLPIYERTGFTFNGKTYPTLGECANGLYPVEVKVTNYIDGDTVTAFALADWLLGYRFDSCFYAKRDSEVPTEEKNKANEAFRLFYGYERGNVISAIKDMRRTPTTDSPNPNYTVKNAEDLDKDAFLEEGYYEIITDLYSRDLLVLGESTRSFYMGSLDTLRYWIFPTHGTAKAVVNGVETTLQDCNDPTYLMVFTEESEYAVNLSPVTQADMTEQQKNMIPGVRVSQRMANRSFTVPVSDIAENVMFAWDSCQVVASTDPVVQNKIGKIGFSMHYSHDRIIQDVGINNYYQQNRTIIFTPVNQQHVDEMKYRQQNPPHTGEKYEEGHPGLWIVNTDTMRAGYTYTLRVQLQDKKSYSLDASEGCLVGYAYFNVIVVPDTMRWTPAYSNEWGDDRNWRAIVDGKEQDYGFAPLPETMVIIPELAEAGFGENTEYPFITENNLYPMDAHYTSNSCNKIHFYRDTRMLNQHLLDYQQAYVDMPVLSNNWYSMAAPLQDMYSGDFFIPHAGTIETPSNLETYSEFEVGRFQGKRHREAPYAFWLSYYNRSVKKIYTSTTETIIPGSSTFAESNALDEPIIPGAGFLVAGYGPYEKEIENLNLRLPKPDGTYYYFDEYGNQDSKKVTLSRTRAYKLAYPLNDQQTVTINNQVEDTIFFFGNPTMAYIDMKAFLADNSDVVRNYYLTLQGSTWIPVSLLTTTTPDQGFVQPMQSVKLSAKTPATSLTLTLKPSHLTLEPSTEATHGTDTKTLTTMPRKQVQHTSHGHFLQTEVMNITAYTPENYATTVLAKLEFANNGYDVEEDVPFMSANVVNMRNDTTIPSPVNMYTIADKQTLLADIRADIGMVPVGFVIDKDSYTDTITLVFQLSTNWTSECYLCDATTGKKERICNDARIKVATPENYEIRYYIQGPYHKPGITTDDPGIITIYDTDNQLLNAFSNAPQTIVIMASEEMTEIRLYDLAGRLVMHDRPDIPMAVRTLYAPTGVVIVKAKLRTGVSVQTKVIVQ